MKNFSAEPESPVAQPASNAVAPTIDLEPVNDNTGPPSSVAPIKRGRPKGSKNKVLSPMGDKKLSREFSEEERQGYAQMVNTMHEDLTAAKMHLHRLADNLEKAKRERTYLIGGFQTFSEFCIAEIGGRSQAYRLLDAREVIQNLLEAGFTEGELPDKERLCRIIYKLSPVDQGKVWKQVLKYRQKSGEEPTGQDVERAVGELNKEKSKRESARDPEPNKARDEEQSEKLNREWGSAAKKFKVGLTLETLDGPTRMRLAAILSEVQTMISQLMTTLAHGDQEEKEGRDAQDRREEDSQFVETAE